jgi:hypothetical protein
MRAVTAALAAGVITPGEAGTIAGVVDTFVRAIETSDFERRLKELESKTSSPSPQPSPRKRGEEASGLSALGLDPPFGDGPIDE